MIEFATAISRLSGLGQPVVLGLLLAFLRTGAMMALLPAFGEQTVPPRVRLGLALAFSTIIAPAIMPQIGAAEDLRFPHLANEIAAGLILGIGLRLLIHALQIAGAMIAQATSLAQLFSATAEPQPVVGNILTMAGLALAVMAGLHVRVAELLILSYDLLPPTGSPIAADAAHWGLAQVSHAFALAFSLAAPFVAAAAVFNAALGFINRAMPQLMVFFIGTPALTLGGLALMAILLPLTLAIWMEGVNAFLADPFGLPQ